MLRPKNVLLLLVLGLSFYALLALRRSPHAGPPDPAKAEKSPAPLISTKVVDIDIPDESPERFGEGLRAQQRRFCELMESSATTSSRLPPMKPDDSPGGVPKMTEADGKAPFNLKISVYANDDFLSSDLKRNGAWKEDAALSMRRKLDILGKARGRPSAFMDVGANVGWFTFYMGNWGVSTYSFEPVPNNEVLMRTTMCKNSRSMKRVMFFPTAVWNKTCVGPIISEDQNVGDGIFKCDAPSTYVAQGRYYIRGYVRAHTLDDLMHAYSATPLDSDDTLKYNTTEHGLIGSQHIGLLKIDTEGEEASVVYGGLKFLQRAKIPYIRSRFAPSQLGGKLAAEKYLQTLDALGYEIRVGDEFWEGKPLRKVLFYDYAEWIGDNVAEIHMIHREWIDFIRKKTGNMAAECGDEDDWIRPW
ncbi:S-adenosyl-L-methionine-dependent methyltransferase [Cladochytrium replicatum]|nr:S-adenosyl-L-methionine-dependent methyltransferase [Cladochytrium replicatum]